MTKNQKLQKMKEAENKLKEAMILLSQVNLDKNDHNYCGPDCAHFSYSIFETLGGNEVSEGAGLSGLIRIVERELS